MLINKQTCYCFLTYCSKKKQSEMASNELDIFMMFLKLSRSYYSKFHGCFDINLLKVLIFVSLIYGLVNLELFYLLKCVLEQNYLCNIFSVVLLDC